MEYKEELTSFNTIAICKKNIHRMYLSIMQQKKMIEKVSPGIYIDSNKIEDNYYVY